MANPSRGIQSVGDRIPPDNMESLLGVSDKVTHPGMGLGGLRDSNRDIYIPEHRQSNAEVIEEIDEARKRDGSLDASINQKVIWVTQLQRGITGARAQEAMRDVIKSVGPDEMTEFVVKLETGGDRHDLHKLLFI